MKQMLEKFLKKKIVFDTRSSWVYIGRLEKVVGGCAVLSEVDVYDSTQTSTTKERYVMESNLSGVKANRERAYINIDYVVSFSLLEDVKKF